RGGVLLHTATGRYCAYLRRTRPAGRQPRQLADCGRCLVAACIHAVGAAHELFVLDAAHGRPPRLTTTAWLVITMHWYTLLKTVHVTCVTLSFTLFTVRGAW